ncbi:MAG TPA: NADH-quinone oxidoreductase subunit N [Candidatus Kapabacteria bacterium]|nr:NADH-quinone oxidoreductase subunit N [Candidatus Kapabacteria bacterium]
MSKTDLIAALPLIILATTGFVILIWDAFSKKPSRAPLAITIIGSIAVIAAAVSNMSSTPVAAFGGLFFSNTFTNFFTIIFAASVILSSLLAEKYLFGKEIIVGGYCALTVFAACGMIMLASGANLIVTFLGLETMSISFYVLAGLFRTEESSNESSLKYFLLGAFATGFFLYGIALVYGCTGTMNLSDIRGIMLAGAKPVASYSSLLYLIGILFIIVGLSFKVAAFPFHQWAPDVYEGAPTIVSGFMSTAGKTAAFAAFLVLFNYALIPNPHPQGGAEKIQIVLAVLAALSMLYGNIVAIAQTKIKRMLAYSSIAHAGYLLIGIASLNSNGITGVTIYSAVYLLMQIGAFGIVGMLEKENANALDLDDYAGLAKRRPWLALILAVLMFSLAGIPPFAGFFGKYYLFLAAIDAGMVWLAIVGVISSIIASYFYLRVIVLMYFRDAKHDEAVSEKISAPLVAVAFVTVALLVLGLYPSLLLHSIGYFFQ